MDGDREGQTRRGSRHIREEETLMTSKLRALDGSEPARRHRLCEEC